MAWRWGYTQQLKQKRGVKNSSEVLFYLHDITLSKSKAKMLSDWWCRRVCNKWSFELDSVE